MDILSGSTDSVNSGDYLSLPPLPVVYVDYTRQVCDILRLDIATDLMLQGEFQRYETSTPPADDWEVML